MVNGGCYRELPLCLCVGKLPRGNKLEETKCPAVQVCLDLDALLRKGNVRRGVCETRPADGGSHE